MLNPLSVLKHPVFFLFYFISSLAYAQIYSSSSTEATGGAGRAGVEVGDVNYLNPASLVHMHGGNFFSDVANENLVVGVSDISHQIVLPASIAYRQYRFQGSDGNPVNMNEGRLSVADFVVDRLSMGITATYNRQTWDSNSYDQTNGDVGFFFTPIENLGFAVIGYNLLNTDASIPNEIRLQHSAAFGANYVYKRFLRMRADVVSSPDMNFGRPVWMTGGEILLNQFMVFRLGAQDDVLNNRILDTFGFGFTGPRFALHYAFMGSVNSREISRHSIDLLLNF